MSHDPSYLEVALLTDNGEASYAGYHRARVPRDNAHWDLVLDFEGLATGAVNRRDIFFPEYLEAGTLKVIGFAVYLGGFLVCKGPISHPLYLTEKTTASFREGQLQIALDDEGADALQRQPLELPGGLRRVFKDGRAYLEEGGRYHGPLDAEALKALKVLARICGPTGS